MSEARRLFIDCDGVLADFERGARDLLGASPAEYQHRHGVGAFWRQLAKAEGFYARLDPLPDAYRLMDAVRHLDPIILTGLPLGRWAEPQKREWAARHFPGVQVITCLARDKHRHGSPGDVLVDDTARLRAAWEAMGGHFVHHEQAERSLATLRSFFDLGG